MRGLEPKHYLLLSGFLAALATQMAGLQHGWHDALTPQFISGVIMQVSLMIGAMYTGAPGATGQRYALPKEENTIKDPSRIPTILLALALASGGMLTMGCAANRIPSGIVTPVGKAEYRADQVLDRLSELSDLVIGDTGDFPGGIKPADAFDIIEWISGDANGHPPTEGIAQLVAATPGQSWKATAWKSWNSRIRALVLKYSSLAAYVGIVDALLGVM